MEYSEDNLKDSALPIILYGKELRSSYNYLYGYNATVEQNSDDYHQDFFNVIRSIVGDFRSAILADLDKLRINVNKLQSGYNYSLDAQYQYKTNNGFNLIIRIK
jgi:hypothetical protein